MPTGKGEISQGMIKGFAIESDNIGCPSLVIGVALLAGLFRRCRMLAVEADRHLAILGNLVVAIEAQPGLRLLVKWLVAFGTILLKVRVSLNHWSGHDKSLKHRLACDLSANDHRHHGRQEEYQHPRHGLVQSIQVNGDDVDDDRHAEQNKQRQMEHMPEAEQALVDRKGTGLPDCSVEVAQPFAETCPPSSARKPFRNCWPWPIRGPALATPSHTRQQPSRLACDAPT